MTDRFVSAPGNFWKNPDCDLGDAVDMMTRASEDPGGLAWIDIYEMDNGLFSVALNAGLYGNKSPEDYRHLTVSRGRVQQAVDTLAADSLEGEQ